MNIYRNEGVAMIRRVMVSILVASTVMITAPDALAGSGSWNVDASGNWNTAGNWNPAAVPGTLAGDVVSLTTNLTAACSVTLDTGATVGTLNIGDPTSSFFSYTLTNSGGSILTFNNSGSGATLAQTTSGGASDTVSVPITLADNLAVTNVNSLTLPGVISGSGKNLTKSGSGALTLSGASTFTGNIVVNGGLLNVPRTAANDGTSGGFGNVSGGGRIITVNSGASLASPNNNWFGNNTVADANLPVMNINGGTVAITNNYTTVGVLNLTNGATITSTGSGSGSFYGFQLRGSVNVGGTSASTMSGSRDYHLNSNTVFAVADVTGNAAVDLTVSAGFRNQSPDFGNSAGALTKTGVGTMAIPFANSAYSGGATINNGTLQIGIGGSFPGVGICTPLGFGGITVSNGATLVVARVSPGTANVYTYTNAVTLGTGGGAFYSYEGNHHFTGAITVNAASIMGSTFGGKALWLDGVLSGTGNLTLQQSGLNTGYTYDGSYVNVTNAANSYSGTISIVPMTSGNGSFLFIGNATALSNATLNLTGNNSGGSSGGGVNNYVNTLQFSTITSATIGGLSGSGSFDLSNTSSNTLALTVGNSANTTYSGIMRGAGSLTKMGSGTLTLTGTNSYTGATTVSNGTLAVYNTTLASGAVTNVAGTALLVANTTLNGSLTLLGHALLGMTNGTAGTLTVTNGLTLDDGNILAFDLGPTNASDKIVLSGGSYSASGTISISLASLIGFGPGVYPLITGATGIATNNFTVTSTPSSGYSYTLDASGGVLSVVVAIIGATPPMAYWTGAAGASWNTLANWATNPAGTETAGSLPASISEVIFAADNGGHFDTTLDADFLIKKLSYATPSNTTISGANTLTISPEGIAMNTGAGTNTLSAPVALVASQSWTNNSVNPLILNGTVSGSAMTLTLAGSGTVRLGASDRIDDTATLVVSNGTFDLAANNETVAGIQVSGNVSGSGTLTSTSAYDLRSGTVSARLGGSVAAAKTTAGTVVLSGASTFTGGVNLNGGTLQAASAESAGVSGPLGASGAISFGGGTLQYSAVNTNDYSARFSSAVGQDCRIDLNGKTVNFATGLTSPNGMLTVSDSAGGGRLTLAGTSMYAGGTTVKGGTLRQGTANAFGSTNATLTVSNATVDINGYALGVGALNGNGGVVINNGAAAALTIGNGNAAGSLVTRLVDGAGALALAKAGTDTCVLSGSNTFSGGTVVNAGTLQVGTGSAVKNGHELGIGAVTVGGNATLAFVSSSTYTPAIYSNSFVLNGGTVSSADGNDRLCQGATLSVLAPSTIQRQWGHVTQKYLTLDGVLQGVATLTLQGFGGNTGECSSIWVNNPSNTFSGTIEVKANTGTGGFAMVDGANKALQFATVNLTGAQPGGSDVAGLYGVQFLWGVTNPVFGALAGSGNIALSDLNAIAVALTAGGNGGSTVFSGNLSGSGSLTKIGAGTMTLSGSNTYTGITTVSNGTLAVNGSLAFSNAVAVASNATLSGTGTVNGVVTTVAGARLSPGVNGAGTLSLGQAPVLSGGTLVVSLATNGSATALSVAGPLSVSSMAFELATLSNLSKSVTSYPIVTASGGVSGPFKSHNLPAGWMLQYDSAAINIVQCQVGFLLIVQ